MIIWFIIFIVNGIDGLQNGAPELACITLFPNHNGHTAQTGTVPYAIHAELSGSKVIVTISSPVEEVFEGFILQARSATDLSKFIDGEFTKSQFSKTINCFNGSKNTLTHVNRNQKIEIISEWTPKEQLMEEVIFKATVAKQYAIFWSDVHSNPVNLMSYTPSIIKDASVYENCFKTEGCVGLPDGCVEQQVCEILLRYSKSSDGINFNLQGPLEGYGAHYMAMAWSEDPIMGEDSVTECIRDGTNVIARESWNEGKTNTRTKSLQNGSYTGTFIDGLTSCSWTSALVTEANSRTYDFTEKKFYVLLATGEVSEWTLRNHRKQNPSSEALRFTDFHGEEEVTESEERETSRDTGVQQPSVTPTHETDSTSQKEESFIYSNETINGNRGSCLRDTCLSLFAILLFTSKEIINHYMF